MKHHHCDQNDVAVCSSNSTPLPMPLSSTRSSAKLAMAAEDPLHEPVAHAADSFVVEMRGDHSALCEWTIANFPMIKSRALWSEYFELGGFNFRLMIYPKGDSQALPRYLSIYMQIMDPHNTSSPKWDCFASYRLAVDNLLDPSRSVHRDSWHRFSSKTKSHGWCDFATLNSLLDPKVGFLHFTSDSILITADILLLHESFSLSRDIYDLQASNVCNFGGGGAIVVGDVLSGKFRWKVRNFSLFKEMIKTQKITSPLFAAGELNLWISVYQSVVNGVEYLSMCLESKDTEKITLMSDRSFWCLFRMSVLNQKPGNGANHVHRDSYGRFAADNKSGDNTSLGWNDYMKMSDFIGPDSGFVVEDTAVFSTSFHFIKELSSFTKGGALIGSRNGSNARKSDGYMGKFNWRIENFTRLKDLLKKRKIAGLCIKSRRFRIGNRDCRLIVYPRGQSQPPCHLSVFLEVTDSRNTNSDWSCFVSHRLSVVNQIMEEKSVTKESQNRYSKAAKDWGWREFVTLTSLFDQDSGFLVQDTVVFSAEVLILKETSIIEDFADQESDPGSTCSQLEGMEKRISFTWKVENFLPFKEIMETRKIFSKFFQAGGCELRIGIYVSSDTICIYLESEQINGSDSDENFWVRYRMAIVNQKNPSNTVWKESSICTKTWNNSVLQFMKLSDMLKPDAGFLMRNTVVFVCEILDFCQWFEFSDLQVLASKDDQDASTTDPDELIDSDDNDGLSGDEEDTFRNLLFQAGFHLTYEDNSSQPQVTLREKLLMDAGAIAGFLTGLRVYLDDPTKVKRLLLPTKISGCDDGKKNNKNDESSPSLMNLLMGVKVLQQAIIDLLLDIMVECCQSLESGSSEDFSCNSYSAISPLDSDRDSGVTESGELYVRNILDLGIGESINASSVLRSNLNGNKVHAKTVPGQATCPPEISAASSLETPPLRSKTKWPEQSEELLGLIVNSLRALDGVVPQGCPEPRRRPHSAQKIDLVLDNAPKHLQPDLVALVPKLVEHSEHSLAGCALLDRLQKPDAEPALYLPVFGAISQLECSSEAWEHILFQSLELLADSNDEPLAATVNFVFKAALHCQHLPEAARSVRVRLQKLGTEVSPCVLNSLSQTVASCADVAESILRDMNSDVDFGDEISPIDCGLFMFGESSPNYERLLSGEADTFHGSSHFSDIYILIDMLSIPCLAVEAAQVFERAVARGDFVPQCVAMALERWFARALNFRSQYVAQTFQQANSVRDVEVTDQLRAERNDFNLIVGLAETLALSTDSLVKGFVKIMYTMLFKQYADESQRLSLLKRVVDRTLTTVDTSYDLDLNMEILIIIVSEEQETVTPVLNMMRKVVELANVDRATLWHQLCATEDDILHIREKIKIETASSSNEKAVLSQRLTESEATNSRLKSEMRAEVDRFAQERKVLKDKRREIETQLEWVHSEKEEELSKLMIKKKVLQDCLYPAESQLSQFKSRRRDELKRVMKEKNGLVERLKNAEVAQKRFDEELKRFATENASRESFRKSLEDEVSQLTQTVGRTEKEKHEEEEQVAQRETYIVGMKSTLQDCQQYIHHLEAQLQEEMWRHAPLYSVGLEVLSMNELETISQIHEEGLRQIRTIQQHRGSPAGSHVNSHPLTHNHGLYPSTPPPLMPNSVGIHNNGHVNDGVGPWFNH